MDLSEVVTVTKIYIDGAQRYLLVRWHSYSFEMYIYAGDGTIWKGRFSTNRLRGFSKNLHLTEDEYYDKLQRCLSQSNEEYEYELKSSFFYWKRKAEDSTVLEGFLPVEEQVSSNKSTPPDLIEILLAINKDLKDKVSTLTTKFNTIKMDFQRCLKDTEEFLNLKVEMERSLCDKFLNLVHLKKSKVQTVEDGIKKIELIERYDNNIKQ